MAGKRTSKKSKYQKQKARANYRRERRENCVVESWTDKEAGNTYEERMAHWDATRKDRYTSGEMEGCGWRHYNPMTGKVEDYEFNSTSELLASMKASLYQTPTSDDGTKQVSFPSLGVGILDMNNPHDAAKAELATELVVLFRNEVITQSDAAGVMARYDSLPIEVINELRGYIYDVFNDNKAA